MRCQFCGNEGNYEYQNGFYLCKKCIQENNNFLSWINQVFKSDDGTDSMEFIVKNIFTPEEQEKIEGIQKDRNEIIDIVNKQLYANDQVITYLGNCHSVMRCDILDIHTKFITDNKVETYVKTKVNEYILYSKMDSELSVDYVRVQK
jgi:hypothetical protein